MQRYANKSLLAEFAIHNLNGDYGQINANRFYLIPLGAVRKSAGQ